MSKNKVNQETGLTLIQEQAVSMLSMGNSVTEVARKLEVSRTTLYSWIGKPDFQAYYNGLCGEHRKAALNAVESLANAAIVVLRESLESDDEATRIKTAMWIVDKLTKKIPNNFTINELDNRILADGDGWQI